MRIARHFTWSDGRPVRSIDIAPRVTHAGVRFALRTWDIRYPPGEERVTDAFYDEVVDESS
jgi:hypothetical protein